MICFGWKGGIGTASRRVGNAHVGVLALTNFGTHDQLRVDGVPVGRLLDPPPPGRAAPSGSCIVVIATDAALGTHQLTRLARRAGLGLGRTGSIGHHGSGEIFVALSTAEGDAVPDRGLNQFFGAVVDATEESVLNSLWAAEDVEGREEEWTLTVAHDDAAVDRYVAVFAKLADELTA